MEKTPSFNRQKVSFIEKEMIIGLLAMGLGAYNLLSTFKVIKYDFTIPQMIGNVFLLLAGMFLLITAFKLGRYKHYMHRLF